MGNVKEVDEKKPLEGIADTIRESGDHKPILDFASWYFNGGKDKK